MVDILFDQTFEALTGRAPFGWQRRLYETVVSNQMPAALDVPTGLGKTSVIAIWLIALSRQAQAGPDRVTLPRRLVYVVDRHTVVDQSTDVAMRLRERLNGSDPLLDPVRGALRALSASHTRSLSISTLRGEFADNREWQEDPARAAIVVGTVDMIGSRLLFSGYSVSRRMRPFHAGLLGHDTLIVHDEAHLSPAFGKLIRSIKAVQAHGREPRPIRVMELSATQHRGGRPRDLHADRRGEAG